MYMHLGPEDVSLLERCPHFRGWYVSKVLTRKGSYGLTYNIPHHAPQTQGLKTNILNNRYSDNRTVLGGIV